MSKPGITDYIVVLVKASTELSSILKSLAI